MQMPLSAAVEGKEEVTTSQGGVVRVFRKAFITSSAVAANEGVRRQLVGSYSRHCCTPGS